MAMPGGYSQESLLPLSGGATSAPIMAMRGGGSGGADLTGGAGPSLLPLTPVASGVQIQAMSGGGNPLNSVSASAGNSHPPMAAPADPVSPPAPAPNTFNTPFYYFDNNIIKIIRQKSDGTHVYQILNSNNTWGEEIEGSLPRDALTPIVCPPKKQDGGRRKRIRRTVRAKAKARPTRRRHRKRT